MNICVRNLGRDVKEKELKETFADFGAVASINIYPSKNGRKESIAFVDMPDDEEARKAIAYLDGVEFQGKNLSVLDAAQEDAENENDYSEYEDDGEAVAHSKHTKRHNPDSDRR